MTTEQYKKAEKIMKKKTEIEDLLLDIKKARNFDIKTNWRTLVINYSPNDPDYLAFKEALANVYKTKLDNLKKALAEL